VRREVAVLEYAALSIRRITLAEGEELGSNLLQVLHRRPAK
jgi:hypothetical protein